MNGPQAVVVSGDLDAVDEWLPVCADRKTTRLRVSHAFHSQRMDPMLAEFRRVAESLSYAEPRIPVVSNVTGQLVTSELTDPGYWVEHVRRPVRFLDGIRALAGQGVTRFLELGPDAVLTAMTGSASTSDVGRRGGACGRVSRRPTRSPVSSAGRTSRACTLDWAAFYAGTGARRVDLPTYAFQRERYWISAAGRSG